MDYFYTPPSLIKNTSLKIEGEELHHLSKVLRKKVGEMIFVVDGNEHAYKVVIRTISRSTVECEIEETLYRWNEAHIEVKLAVALLKNPSRFDFLVEKCTELGVREFIPVRTERTIASKVHLDRLQKIALSAMKQCGRSFLPPVHPPMDFLVALTHLKGCEGKFITHEKTGDDNGAWRRKEVGGELKSIGILVGPEGGFTDEEIQSAIASGFTMISLGTRRLRSETAAVAVASLFLI